MGLVPFFSGGFYGFLAFPISLLILLWLVHVVKKNGEFRFWLSDALLAIAGIVLVYGISALWAVDKGMSWWGAVKHMPLLLYALAIMQMEPEERKNIFDLVPLSGTVMTVLSFPLQFVPSSVCESRPMDVLRGSLNTPIHMHCICWWEQSFF